MQAPLRYRFCCMETVLIFSLFISEQMGPDQVERLRNTVESNVQQSGKQEGQRPSGIQRKPQVKNQIFHPISFLETHRLRQDLSCGQLCQGLACPQWSQVSALLARDPRSQSSVRVSLGAGRLSLCRNNVHREPLSHVNLFHSEMYFLQLKEPAYTCKSLYTLVLRAG